MSPEVTRRSMLKVTNDQTTLEYRKKMRPKGTTLCELHENGKCKPNNMTEIYVVNSKDYVMCSGRGSLEEHDEQEISTR